MTTRGTFLFLLLASAAAAQDTTTTVQAADKMSPGVQQALVQGATVLSLFIELQAQPQADILQRTEAGSSRLNLAKTNFERLAGFSRTASSPNLDSAREELDAATTNVRHEAAQTIQDEIRNDQNFISGLLSSAGATNIQRFYIVNVLSADVPASAVTMIARRPEVARILLVGSGSGTLNTAAGVGAPVFWDAPNFFTGVGQIIAVLDSGINENHPAFRRVTFEDAVFLNNAHLNNVVGCEWDEPTPLTANDVAGHGTLVADSVAGEGVGADAVTERGVAYGVAQILNVKIAYKCKNIPSGPGGLREDDVLAGLQFAVFDAKHVASIVNLSLAGIAPGPDNPLSDYVDRIIDLSGGKLVITVAAGNGGIAGEQTAPSGKPEIFDPATAYNAITVGSEQVVDGVLQLKASTFSSRGPTADGRRKPDLSAPGSDLDLANNLYVKGAAAPAYLTNRHGTSFSAPQVAGAAALLRELGVLDQTAVKAILINSAVRSPAAPSKDPWRGLLGWGYMRLGTLPALLQRTDGKVVCEGGLNGYVSACVTDSLSFKDDLRFYEGDGKGEFKATLVWNRHFTNGNQRVSQANAPLKIDKLALTLYHDQRARFVEVDKSNTAEDNVQQVNADEHGKVLVKVKLTHDLATGVTHEPYGLAFLTPLTPVAQPSLTVSCVVPSNLQPLQSVAVACTASNSGGLPVFNASATANPGTVDDGSLGTISAHGSSQFTVNVTVPDLASPAVSVLVILTGAVAGESYSGSTAFLVAPSPQGCPTPTLNPAAPITVPLSGDTYTIQVSGLPSTCKWIFRFSQDDINPWISSPQAGISMASPGTFTLTAAQNQMGLGRTGAVLVSSGPNLNGIIAPSAVLQLAQEGAPYGPVQGSASLPLVGEIRRPLPGVTVHFQLITGKGPIPADVTTDAGGFWSASGFTTGIFVGQDPTLANTYRATPSKAGYTFTNPQYYEFGGQPNSNPNFSSQNFIGTPTN